MADSKTSYIETTTNRLPVPDPTILTTQQLVREVGSLKELFETRLDAMDKAIVLLQAFADRQPTTTSVAHSVEALKELMEEKFAGVKTRIDERDIQNEKDARDVKSAVDSAFAAAKEAVGEQNKSTTKQIDGIYEAYRANTKTVDDKIGDIKDRLTMIESHSKGAGDMWGYVIGFVGVAVSVLMAAIVILRH